MKKSKLIRLYIVFIFAMTTALLGPAIARGNSGKWKPASALPQKKGVDSVMVKVEKKPGDIIHLNYSLPPANLEELDEEFEGKKMKRLKLGNAPRTSRQGEPVLPAVTAKIIIPAGCSIDQLEITRGNKITLAGDKHLIEYGQVPIPLMMDAERQKAVPKPEIYASDNSYPQKTHDVVTIQRKRGVTIAVINLHPIEYKPKSGKLYYYKNISLEIKTKPEIPAQAMIRCRPHQLNPALLGAENPEDLATYQETVGGLASLAAIVDPVDSYEYVLITSAAIRDAATDVTVHDLIAHRQFCGLTATIVTIEDILVNYAGIDNAAKLRNFIIDAYNNWETNYVLLGGDTNVIPMRKLYCETAPGELFNNLIDDIPSDVYFQCLDGSYNSDGDFDYGEYTDGADIPEGSGDVDLMAEVLIGRASAEDAQEMSNFVYKTLAYENEDNSAEYLRRALMAGEFLGQQFGQGEFAYGKPCMEEIRLGGNTTAGFASSALFTVDTLYEYDNPGDPWRGSDIIALINSDVYGIIDHLGHASSDYVMRFYNSDADALTNTNYIFAYSHGCNPGRFEDDCIAEHLTTSNRYGMFAGVFNSRFGFGAYNTTDTPSQRFNSQFWDAYFSEFILNLGAINADSHEDNIGDINGDCIRWCFYQTNLFGDPYTPIHGLNTGPSLGYASHTTDDSVGGNSDGLINPDEEISLMVTIKNRGTESALSVSAQMTTSDSYISIINDTVSFGDIACCGAEKEGPGSFSIGISSDCPAPHTATLELTITDSEANSWSSELTVTVYTSYQISGYVKTAGGDDPIEGAAIEYAGAISGFVLTDPNGYYLFGSPEGAYTLIAKHDQYLDSNTQDVIIPPTAENINFQLKRPEIVVAPLEIIEAVSGGDSLMVDLEISNPGDASFDYSIFLVGSTLATSFGSRLRLRAGADISYGYSWKDSDEWNGPEFVWNDISSTGTLLSEVSYCNDCYQQQAISFGFPYYDNTYSSIYVGSNGYITLGAGATAYYNYELPSVYAPANLIGPFYDDLLTYTGSIYFQDYGNKVVVQYENIDWYAAFGSCTFQVHLHESGKINFYYKEIIGAPISVTVGMQNEAKDDGFSVVHNDVYLREGLAVEILRDREWLTVAPVSGTIDPAQSALISVTLDATDLDEGVYTGELEIWHNAPPLSSSPITVSIQLTVGGGGSGDITVSPTSPDFGDVQVVKKDITVTVENTGTGNLAVHSVTIENESVAGQFTTDAGSQIIAPNESATITVTYSPNKLGAHTADLIIVSDDPDEGIISIPLSGEGVEPSAPPTSVSKVSPLTLGGWGMPWTIPSWTIPSWTTPSWTTPSWTTPSWTWTTPSWTWTTPYLTWTTPYLTSYPFDYTMPLSVGDYSYSYNGSYSYNFNYGVGTGSWLSSDDYFWQFPAIDF